MSPHLVDLLMRPWTAEDFTDADRQRKAMCNTMWRFMANYDLLLTPTLAVPPFPVHMQGPEIIDGRMVRSADWLSFTFPANLTGQPAASVPAGFTTDGLPVGLQIIGRHLADRTVLRASARSSGAALGAPLAGAARRARTLTLSPTPACGGGALQPPRNPCLTGISRSEPWSPGGDDLALGN